ncbi:uclacyanin-3-like [Pyrus communis]|uniref:uclacyanin-3-like n=1 Tax=Pyrus communis TaxID=23211 RepID=UPI0035C10E3F
MESKVVIVFGVIVALFLHSVAGQKVHVVGGSIGSESTVNITPGSQPPLDSSSPAVLASFTLSVAALVVVFLDGPSSENPIGTAITTGPANITLTSSGDHYYICTYGRHCQSGQKLAITVSAASPGAAPSVPPPPSTTNTPPTTPSPTSNDPAACAPVPASSPSMNGGVPTVNNTPGSPPPLGSSSPAVLASFSLSAAALIVGLLF